MHLANMNSSAVSSKQMVIALETQVTFKDSKILKLKDSVNSKEEQLRQSFEREAHSSSKQNAAEVKITELERRLKIVTEEAAKFKNLAEKNCRKVKELTE